VAPQPVTKASNRRTRLTIPLSGESPDALDAT
jgi:hypothetical protein